MPTVSCRIKEQPLTCSTFDVSLTVSAPGFAATHPTNANGATTTIQRIITPKFWAC
ncbi:hypothetical protein CHELA41_23442 [Hyphomicrobiales bacterium]|nr:hypothetical protein CHELA41_23442 [Hyphomicrobiales bacterium]